MTERKHGGSESTPNEEIERQHQEALWLTQKPEGYSFKPPVLGNGNEIPLRYKSQPTSELLLENDGRHFNPDDQAKEDWERQQGGCCDAKEDSFDDDPHVIKPRPIRITIPCWSSRGVVDVSALQSLFREGYNRADDKANDDDDNNNNKRRKRPYKPSDVRSLTDLWDEANAAVHNVRIQRPSHDAWGIRKVVLVFCDDFLQRIYELPWWHDRPEIRDAVKPILDVLGIADCRRIARLLLASLPPGVTM